jgi:hypothetical protein
MIQRFPSVMFMAVDKAAEKKNILQKTCQRNCRDAMYHESHGKPIPVPLSRSAQEFPKSIAVKLFPSQNANTI